MIVEIIVFGLWILLVFALLAWFVGAGLMASALTSRTPSFLERILDYKGAHCACYLGLHQHTK
jgi:type IV secretory pathway TrbD component